MSHGDCDRQVSDQDHRDTGPVSNGDSAIQVFSEADHGPIPLSDGGGGIPSGQTQHRPQRYTIKELRSMLANAEYKALSYRNLGPWVFRHIIFLDQLPPARLPGGEPGAENPVVGGKFQQSAGPSHMRSRHFAGSSQPPSASYNQLRSFGSPHKVDRIDGSFQWAPTKRSGLFKKRIEKHLD
jgi:hypothetical protein